MSKILNVSIIIVNWNGRYLLEKCLQSLKKAVRNYKSGKTEVIIVDNNSSDGSFEFINKNYPEFRIIRSDKNLGFSKGVYLGIKRSQYPIVITLNNDTVVSENFLLPLITPFKENDSLFSVGSKMLLFNKKALDFGRAVPKNILGFIKIKFYNNKKKEYTFYTCAGAAAYNKKKFLSLGGFDDDLLYWEDSDICFRAWRRNWQSIVEPESIVFHKRQASMRKIYSKYEILKVSRRSHFLFMWKNMKSPFFWIQHVFFLLPISILALITFRIYFIRGLIEALPKLKKMIKKNIKILKGETELNIFRKINMINR